MCSSTATIRHQQPDLQSHQEELSDLRCRDNRSIIPDSANASCHARRRLAADESHDGVELAIWARCAFESPRPVVREGCAKQPSCLWCRSVCALESDLTSYGSLYLLDLRGHNQGSLQVLCWSMLIPADRRRGIGNTNPGFDKLPS
jgi:hypothetical protein